MMTGSLVALVTPFKDDRVDVRGLRQNVEFLLAHGTSGLVPCGTTGESPTLSHEEWKTVVATTVAAAGGRARVIAGSGTNDTAKTVSLSQEAERLGANAVLVVAPYYNRPTQEGLYRHFRTVAESIGIEIVMYNIPGRTGVNVIPETIERLARDCPNLTAVKEASGSIDQSSEILMRCGDRVTILSGDDSLTLPILSVGGKGVISVVANIVPGDVADLCANYLAGRTAEALTLHRKLFPLVKAMFVETNPIPIKTAMNVLGKAGGPLRLPLCEPSEANRKAIETALRNYGLLLSGHGTKHKDTKTQRNRR
jgi:4-hydroxy-tetrahydrodipicolinate synthase